MSGIVVATPSEQFAARLELAYGPPPHGSARFWRDGLQTTDLPSLAAEMVAADPNVVIVGPGLCEDAALQLVEACDAGRPDAVTLLVAEPTSDLWPAAVRAGARDVIAPGVTDGGLREAVDRALRAAEQRRAALSATSDPATRGRVISVLSPKGGAGKTTMASNLAVGLAHACPGEVVLLDLDLQFGGVAGALRLVPEHSIADAARAGSLLDAATLKVFLSAHPTGLFALCAPESLAQADDVGPEQLSQIVSLLADSFRFVVIDTAAGIDVVTLAAIELSSDLVAVSTTDVPCVRALRRALDALDAVGLKSQIRHFVLNRADVKGGLSLEDIEAVTGAEVDVSVPDARAVALSLNLGSPILESDPKSAPGKALAELVGPFLRKEPLTALIVDDEHGSRRVRRRQRNRA